MALPRVPAPARFPVRRGHLVGFAVEYDFIALFRLADGTGVRRPDDEIALFEPQRDGSGQIVGSGKGGAELRGNAGSGVTPSRRYETGLLAASNIRSSMASPCAKIDMTVSGYSVAIRPCVFSTAITALTAAAISAPVAASVRSTLTAAWLILT